MEDRRIALTAQSAVNTTWRVVQFNDQYSRIRIAKVAQPRGGGAAALRSTPSAERAPSEPRARSERVTLSDTRLRAALFLTAVSSEHHEG